MTNEEAVKMLEAKLECMRRDVSGIDDDCNRKLCDECHLCYDQGNMGEQQEYLRMSIESLKQESILDKIRAEIEQEYKVESEHPYGEGLRRALQIIDKYKPESEE